MIVGGGRWGVTHASALQKNNNFNKVYIFTKFNFNKLKNKFNSINSKIIIINKLQLIDLSTLKLVILCNKYDKNYYYLKVFSKYNLNLIIEKPFINGPNKFIYYYNKFFNQQKNFILSTPWTYNYSLNAISKLIKIEQISSIEFIWLSKKNSIKYGEKRKFDNRISFTIDIISHIISILIILFNNEYFIFKKIYFQKNKKNEMITFQVLDKNIFLKCSSNSLKEQREIIIKTFENKTYKLNLHSKYINFFKSNKKLRYNNKLNQLESMHNVALEKVNKNKSSFNIFKTISVNTLKVLKKIN